MPEKIEFNGMLTKEEFLKLAQATRKMDGQIDEQEVEKLVNWAIEKRAGASCVDLIVNGFLTVAGFDADGNPNLMPPDDEDFSTAIQMKIPALEESRC